MTAPRAMFTARSTAEEGSLTGAVRQSTIIPYPGVSRFDNPVSYQ